MAEERMQALAVFVCDTDPRRSKTYPIFMDREIPQRIVDDATGDTFSLRAVHYEVGDLEERAARVREWNAKHFGGKAA